MESKLQLLIHGTGNAWPVPLGETHPFYNRTDPRELGNASYSLRLTTGTNIVSEVLVDAGHGAVQSLISGANRIPECICLTHGHMDHTLSVDWIVQSYRRKYERQREYPIYASRRAYRFLIRSYPHLEELIQHTPLLPGRTLSLFPEENCRLSSYPVYHGPGAEGATMLYFEWEGKRILFTGDLITPLLRRSDYEDLKNPDLVVADTNNRFPWPRTNHWSFCGQPGEPLRRSGKLADFVRGLTWEEVALPHRTRDVPGGSKEYFRTLGRDWPSPVQPFTLIEFLQHIQPEKTVLVHYSGMEDARYHSEPLLGRSQLRDWCNDVIVRCGLETEILVPDPGTAIEI